MNPKVDSFNLSYEVMMDFDSEKIIIIVVTSINFTMVAVIKPVILTLVDVNGYYAVVVIVSKLFERLSAKIVYTCVNKQVVLWFCQVIITDVVLS